MKGNLMRMRTIVLAGLAAVGMAAGVQASTITVSMDSVLVSGSTYNINIYAKTDQAQTSAGQGDGGIAGFQFDILSNGSNLIAPVAAGAGPNAAKVKTTFNVSSSDFATQLLPNKEDASAADGYASDSDTDLDAIAGSFADTNGSFTNTTLGQNTSENGGKGHLIATEQWTLAGATPDFLSLHIIGAQYYDFGNTGNNFRTDFANVVATGTAVPVPEPTSLGLLSLVGLGALRRRRA